MTDHFGQSILSRLHFTLFYLAIIVDLRYAGKSHPIGGRLTMPL